MKDEEIKGTVMELFREIAPEADFDALPPHQDLRRALDIDSFDFLNFIIGLDEALGVDIPESDYGKLNTLSDILGYLSERLG
jgi:acyl carrier protein